MKIVKVSSLLPGVISAPFLADSIALSSPMIETPTPDFSTETKGTKTSERLPLQIDLVCYIETSTGSIINLEHLCGDRNKKKIKSW